MKYDLDSLLADIALDEQRGPAKSRREPASQDEIRALRLQRLARKADARGENAPAAPPRSPGTPDSTE